MLLEMPLDDVLHNTLKRRAQSREQRRCWNGSGAAASASGSRSCRDPVLSRCFGRGLCGADVEARDVVERSSKAEVLLATDFPRIRVVRELFRQKVCSCVGMRGKQLVGTPAHQEETKSARLFHFYLLYDGVWPASYLYAAAELSPRTSLVVSHWALVFFPDGSPQRPQDQLFQIRPDAVETVILSFFNVFRISSCGVHQLAYF